MRTDWRDTVRDAADLAVLGLLVVVASFPLLTAGAALATGSAAIHQRVTHDRWPGPRALWPVFRRTLLPGAAAVVSCGLGAWLLAFDVSVLRSGAVPGGPALLVATCLVTAASVGYLGLTVVALGRGAPGWLPALRRATTAPPLAVAASAGVVALAAVLAVLVHPILAACLTGHALYALHAVHTRTAPTPSTPQRDPAR